MMRNVDLRLRRCLSPSNTHLCSFSGCSNREIMMNTPTIPCPFCVYLLVVFGVLHFVSAVIPSPPTISKHPILPPSDYLLFQIAVNQDEKEKPFALECEANGEPMPTYKWTKDGQPFQWQAYDSRIIQQIDRGTLVMMNLTDEDEGYYQCLAENEHGTALSNGVFVRKSEFNLFPDDKTQIKTEGEPLTGFSKARPYWVSQPNDTTAAENEDVEFECKAGGVPKPEINWFVHGVPLNEAPPNPRRKFISSTIIRIEKLQKSDTAVYQCNASSALGYVFSNFYINVLALPPIIVEPPKAKYEAVDSLSIILTCRVFGAPKPHVVWKMNGKELTGGRFNVLDSGDLEIHNVLFSDAGNYSCEANNSLGVALSDMDVGYLEVRAPLESPHNFSLVRVVDGNTADFSWEPVHPNSVRGHFKGYKIEIWSTLEGEKPMREIVVPSESSSARVKLFVPFTMTNVRMRVLNSMHEGPPTPVISFQTPEGNGSGS